MELLSTEEVVGKRKREFLRELRNIVLILAALLIFRSVFYEPYRIPSGSMIPTLKIGDFILVNKFAYGFKLPFSDLAIFDINWKPVYLFGKEEVKRGDVIVFKWPKDPSINYIKRVIAGPGDEIEIKNKVLFINGVAVETKEIDGSHFLKEMDAQYQGNSFRFFESKLSGKKFFIQQDEDNIYSSHLEKTKLPPGKYFVLGDNRDYSSDSRFWGFVSHEDIRGKAIFVWFSMTMGLNNETFKVRSERIFKEIN